MTENKPDRPKRRLQPLHSPASINERTQAERARIVRQYRKHREKGVSALEAASQCGAPISSIYRWLNMEAKLKAGPSSDRESLRPIDLAIDRIASSHTLSRMEIAEHLFYFISWLKWPTRTSDHALGVMSCIAGYLHQRHGACTLSDLPTEEKNYIFRYIRLDVLSRMCSSDFVDFPIFESFPIEGQPFDDRDVLANICWYMLASGKSLTNSRLSASLNKALYLVQADSFKYNWSVSRRTLTSFWTANGAAAPFLYVERFHSGLDFSLDPLSDHFAVNVDALIENRDELRRYFRHCRWAVETLTAQLDPRALQNITFPTFQPHVAAEPAKPPKLTSQINEALAKYGRP